MKIDQKTSVKISWTQFICAIVILFDHCFDYIDYEHAEKSIFENIVYFFTRMLNKGLPYCAMAIFFFLSSFLLYKDWNERSNTKEWYLIKIKSRFFSIVIPYFLWNLIWTVVFLSVGIIDKNGATNITNNPGIKDLFLGVLFGTYNEVFWYLKAIIFYIVVSPLIGYIISKYKTLILVLTFIIAVIPELFTGNFLIFANFYNLFFWSLGAFVAIRGLSMSKSTITLVHRKKEITNYICLFISLIVITHIQGYGIKQMFPYYIQLLLNCVVLTIDILGTTSFFNVLSSLFKNKKVRWYTRTSFLIYAMHKPVEQAFNKLIAKFFQTSLCSHLLNLFGGVAFTLAVVLVAIKIMCLILPKTTLLLNGGRKILD